MAARRISPLLSRSAPLLSRGGKQSYTSRGIFQYTTAAAALEEPIKPPVSVQYDKLLINGQFADAASGKNFPSLDPRTGEVITHVPEGDAEDINRAVLAARKAFDEGPWPKMTAYVTKYPRVFGVQNRLKPLLDEFRDLGFSPNEVRREVLREPKVLGLENGELSHCVEMLRTLKCRAAIKDQIFRNGEFRAGYEAKLRIDCLRKHGLIYRDAFTVLWKEPRVIIYEVGDIEKKIAFLVNTMKFDIRCIVEVPEYLGVNFEKQIVPRFNVIEYLRSSDGLGDEVGLRNLVKMSRLRFYNMYVKPDPECEKMYERFCGDAVVGNGNRNWNRHPVGMWKLFKPEPNPESDDDVEIIKLYMESLHQEKMEHYQGVKKVESK